MAKNLELESWPGQTVRPFKEISIKDKSKDLENLPGLIKKYIKVSG